MPSVAFPSTLQYAIPSYLPADNLGLWGIYLQQVDRVTPYLGSLARWVETLKRLKRVLIVDVPTQTDDGRITHFEGYCVQHNTSCGPGKGGVHLHQDVTLSEVMALSAWMPVKNAAVNVSYGGAKDDTRVDLRKLSSGELERLTRRYTSKIGIIIGPNKDIPASDVNTNVQIMAWVMDTYSMNEGSTATDVVTGKPIVLGGSLGRREATGRGAFMVGSKAARNPGIDVKSVRVVVQGFGNVGSVAAKLFHDTGAKVIAVQDHKGIVFNGNDLDVDAFIKHVDYNGSVVGFIAEAVLQDDSRALDCESLIPVALEGQITTKNVPHIEAKITVEGANGPTTPEADDIPRDRGILVCPDVIVNADGVTVSYFERVQDFSSLFWTEDEINQRLVRIMQDALRGAWQVAQNNKVTPRTVASTTACTWILQTRQGRGLYP